MNTTNDVINSRAKELGMQVWFHAMDLDRDAEVGHGSDEPVVLASVLKVPVAAELARQGIAGDLDLSEPVELSAAERTASPSGIAAFRDPVRLSLHDLAIQMMAVSDNAATDVLMCRVGRVRIAELLDRLGLDNTVVPQDCAEIVTSIADDLGLTYTDDESALASVPPERLNAIRALNPSSTCRSTPRETATLLSHIWLDDGLPPKACALVRHWMSFQAWDDRMASGFPDGVEVYGKTGTLPSIRNEAGVVVQPDGRRHAVAVFTRSHDFRARVPERDSFIGWVAAQAIAHLHEC